MKLNSKKFEPNPNDQVDNKSPHPFLLALILTGILAAEAYPSLTYTAIAAVKVLQSQQLETNDKVNSKANKFANLLMSVKKAKVDSQAEVSSPSFLIHKSLNQILDITQPAINKKIDYLKKLSKSTTKKVEKLSEKEEKIPNDIVDAVLQDLGNQINTPPEKIKVAQVSQETWPNTCLGLAKSDELCGQMLIEGWRIVLSDGNDTWVYRTDDRGKLIRVEPKN